MNFDQAPKATSVKFSSSKPTSLKLFLNGSILALLLIVCYFSYVFITRASTTGSKERENPKMPPVIQLDVMNGCGVNGVGMKFATYLREQGFDVVEVKNYKTFNVPQSVVIDRVGNVEAARGIARILGIPEKHVIQQINLDYFVDVSVIVGLDYLTLQAVR
ncbi:MAG: LytR C-terminal domain-containing protein [Ignavibacteriae bacterium]|nr:LytR C-terminal domain-containing protein [Ignavibacteriota bacterium]